MGTHLEYRIMWWYIANAPFPFLLENGESQEIALFKDSLFRGKAGIHEGPFFKTTLPILKKQF